MMQNIYNVFISRLEQSKDLSYYAIMVVIVT